jgi:hypothetical protein
LKVLHHRKNLDQRLLTLLQWLVLVLVVLPGEEFLRLRLFKLSLVFLVLFVVLVDLLLV